MTSQLFSPIHLGTLELVNRIVVAPMCQYTAADGTVGDWHIMHLGQFAVSGAGLIFVEATGVEPEGRITHGCTGLWSDENEAAFKRVLEFCKRYGNVPVGIQIAHAGRKGSIDLPWRGGKPLKPEEGAWQTTSASALPYADGWHTPVAADSTALTRIKNAWAQSATRAARIGFAALELHGAHGYLLHQFLSPISNVRNDGYGGGRDGRMRFPLEVFEAVRKAWPKDRPLGYRISATDWVDGGWALEDSIAFVSELKSLGCDFVDVSSGGSSPKQKIAVGPGYQTPFAAAIKRETGITTMAVGKITDAVQAEQIVCTGQADLVALARGMIMDPHWAWHAAMALGARAAFPPQYQRCHPALWGEPIPGNAPPPDKAAEAAWTPRSA